MTLEQLVPTLEVCQQLKAAGFPQGTALVWYKTWDDKGKEGAEVRTADYLDYAVMDGEPTCAAPTAGELEEWLRAKYPDAVISSFRRGDLGMDADIDDDVLDCHKGVGQYPAHVAALAALVLEVAG